MIAARVFSFAAFVGLSAVAIVVRAEGPTLGELAGERREALVAELGAAAAGERVTSWAELREEGEQVVAGYLESEVAGGGLGPLHVWRFDGETGRWRHRVLEAQGAGSVLAVRAVGRYLLLRLHHSPSSSSERVLSRDLEPLRELSGSAVAVAGDGRVVVQAGQPHFQAVHETRLALVDLANGEETPLFPPVPETPWRRALIERAAAEYRGAGEGWCARNNHPCDPARLESDLLAIRSAVAADALAFVVAYDVAPLEPVGPTRKAVYLVRGLRSGELEIGETLLPGGPVDAEAAVAEALARAGEPVAKPAG